MQCPSQDAGVAAYLCGHDHDLQYITKTAGQQATATGQPAWPVYVVSGAGSNIRTNEFAQYKARVSGGGGDHASHRRGMHVRPHRAPAATHCVRPPRFTDHRAHHPTAAPLRRPATISALWLTTRALWRCAPTAATWCCTTTRRRARCQPTRPCWRRSDRRRRSEHQLH